MVDDDDPFGKKNHDSQLPSHKGEFGHYCYNWDGLYICGDCSEIACCTCLDVDSLTEEERKRLSEIKDKWCKEIHEENLKNHKDIIF